MICVVDMHAIVRFRVIVSECRLRPESSVRGSWRGYNKFRLIVSDNGVKGRGYLYCCCMQYRILHLHLHLHVHFLHLHLHALHLHLIPHIFRMHLCNHVVIALLCLNCECILTLPCQSGYKGRSQKCPRSVKSIGKI